ncbi:hypothetical protein J7373_15050 [Xanthomonas sp. A2111]|uniref:Uncharacterized protein n=1 Tax=Xanthomonas hawaiiensis TaxID=3003247 RepID=A0ABU2I8F2_9XANT|nr:MULTISPECIES: hypothetical protein [unclassified Xanthomonas]MBO9829568.1 hypothetical protein [Xanthomonas sp. A2111]MBO9875388.1 hypothetical protein [Xanthomonas sp. D-93]MDS9993667.1 hypothetical protein [Xanthomonas sp. A2111]WNH45407.1 hypothetical protein PG878_02780 [Xanthomonas sp. A6251]
MSNDNKRAAAPEVPPDAGSVLYLIYGWDGDGAVSYEIDNGAVVNFWGGQHVELDGKQYYTGFSYATPGHYGIDDAETFPNPGEGVSLGAATFLLTTPGGERPWMVLHAQRYVGSFGAYARADAFDSSRAPQQHALGDGRLLLAVPTTRFGNGITEAGFAVFVFDPNRHDLGDYRSWVYCGTVAAGEDNEAASDPDGVVPHVSSTGTLEFQTVPGQRMPALRVALHGTAIAGPGRARLLDASDVLQYAFDPDSGQYRPAPDA